MTLSEAKRSTKALNSLKQMDEDYAINDDVTFIDNSKDATYLEHTTSEFESYAKSTTSTTDCKYSWWAVFTHRMLEFVLYTKIVEIYTY